MQSEQVDLEKTDQENDLWKEDSDDNDANFSGKKKGGKLASTLNRYLEEQVALHMLAANPIVTNTTNENVEQSIKEEIILKEK